jgi:protein SCO1/2
MGFTSCKYACPRIIGDMKRIETELGADADKAAFVFFSFDTATDEPAQMKKAAGEQKLDLGRWTFAISDDETIRQLAVALQFKFATVEGFLTHSNLIAVLDADGNIVHREESLGADIAPTVTALKKLLPP